MFVHILSTVVSGFCFDSKGSFSLAGLDQAPGVPVVPAQPPYMGGLHTRLPQSLRPLIKSPLRVVLSTGSDSVAARKSNLVIALTVLIPY